MKPKNEVKTIHRHINSLSYIQKSYDRDPSDGRFYNGAYLLNEGEYSDCMSRSLIVYSSTELEMAVKRWGKNKIFNIDDERIFVNLDHKPDECLKRVGYLTNLYFDDDAIRGDIYLHRITEESRKIVTLIDAGYIEGLSVEITTEDYWDNETNKRCASNIELLGLAIVTMPADSRARIK